MVRARRAVVTMHDVARAAEVSIATVSRVVNGRDGVGEPTIERVRAVIAELGYESSLVASSLRRTKTEVVALVCLNFELFTAAILKGVTQAVRGSGYDLIVHINCDEPATSHGWEQRQVARLSGTLADGCLVVTPWAEVESSTPVVAIDARPDSRMHEVSAENLEGSLAAVDHLLHLGHRRIGFIAGRADLASAATRERGYRLALERAGIEVDPSLITQGDFLWETAVEPALALLDRDDRPTAVFAANDSMAMQVVAVAQELGLLIPEDLSVVGFDNIPESALCDPPLTTVDQHPHDLGVEAAKLLLRLIQAPDDDHEQPPTRLSLPTDLVVRRSTAPPSPEVAAGRPATGRVARGDTHHKSMPRTEHDPQQSGMA